MHENVSPIVFYLNSRLGISIIDVEKAKISVKLHVEYSDCYDKSIH